MSAWDDRITQFFAAVTHGAFRGMRVGPGVLRTITPQNMVGLVVILGIVFLLRSNDLLAGGIAVLVLGYMVYSSERAFRYAEKHPLPALLGGTELFQLVRDQLGAKDKSIISETDPVIGASNTLIEGNSE